jgi:protoporphyrinogen IX oxidase
MASLHPWFKAFHIIGVIAWMAGLLYLPRLFVYHAGTDPQSPASATFKTMERRLLAIIMRPAMLITVLFGGALISMPGVVDWSMGWMKAKLALVVLLIVAHGLEESWCARFARDANTHTPRFYRIFNEIPTLLMIGIVILVVVKPF